MLNSISQVVSTLDIYDPAGQWPFVVKQKFRIDIAYDTDFDMYYPARTLVPLITLSVYDNFEWPFLYKLSDYMYGCQGVFHDNPQFRITFHKIDAE